MTCDFGGGLTHRVDAGVPGLLVIKSGLIVVLVADMRAAAQECGTTIRFRRLVRLGLISLPRHWTMTAQHFRSGMMEAT